MMDIHKILKQLPHRYPFLLVDRVLEIEKGVRIKALKNVTINEPFFMGHFPHRPEWREQRFACCVWICWSSRPKSNPGFGPVELRIGS